MSLKKIISALCVVSIVGGCSGNLPTRKKSVQIVDKEGNPATLKRRMPEFNKKQLSKQQQYEDKNIQILSKSKKDKPFPKDIFADKAPANKKTKEEVVILETTESESKLRKEIKGKKTTRTKKAAASSTVAVGQAKYQRGKYYVQLGAYKSRTSADRVLSQNRDVSNGLIRTFKNRNQVTIHRVLLGPFSTKKQAKVNLDKVVKKGHYDVYITTK